MAETIRFIDRDTAEYRYHYRLGWVAGERGSEGALDRADARNVPHAWYDGYMDAAAGREMWHIPNCQDAECKRQHG